MKHVFVLNPKAGKREIGGVEADIAAVCEAAPVEYEIYETKAPGDAAAFVRKCCEDAGHFGRGEPAETIRFYAYGGDGSLHEAVNGAAGSSFAEIACIPAGTGNDFVRNFPGRDFLNLPAQIRGSAVPCDLIRYSSEEPGNGKSGTGRGGAKLEGYCVNMFNIGFDCNVVDMTDRMKRLPMITGSLAYLGSIAAMLIRKKGADLKVEYGDGFSYDGKLLLISVANGAFCGGGIKGLPRAATDDGEMDVSLVRNVSRATFVRLFPKYMKGTHLEVPELQDVVRYTREKKLYISPNGGSLKLCVDGEIVETGPIRFEIVPKAFRFVIPAV